MIIIKYLSVTGAEIGEHSYDDSDSLQEAEDFVRRQLLSDEIIASTSNRHEITVFKSEHVAGYKLILRTRSKVVAKPF